MRRERERNSFAGCFTVRTVMVHCTWRDKSRMQDSKKSLTSNSAPIHTMKQLFRLNSIRKATLMRLPNWLFCSKKSEIANLISLRFWMALNKVCLPLHWSVGYLSWCCTFNPFVLHRSLHCTVHCTVPRSELSDSSYFTTVQLKAHHT